MVKQYQEVANFLFGVRDIKELQDMAEMASAMSSPQKFCVQRALVLTAGEYRFYTEKDFREPFFGIHQQGPCPAFDVQTQTWNCVLVVSETGKDGVLVSKEPDANCYYVAYVPEHSSLRLRADLPVDFWTGVSTTNLQLQQADGYRAPQTEQENRQQHFASFVGMVLQTMWSELHFTAYDPETDRMTVRLYGGPGNYMENDGTPEQIAENYSFSQRLRDVFFDMDYRNISHPCRQEARQAPSPKTPGKSREEGR